MKLFLFVCFVTENEKELIFFSLAKFKCTNLNVCVYFDVSEYFYLYHMHICPPILLKTLLLM